jgi:Tfp pilus assembly protein PilO
MKINPRYFLILVIVLAVILFAVGFMLLVLPEKNKVSKASDDVSKAKSEYQREQGRQTQLNNYNKDPEQFVRQINALKDKIPENMDLADVIQELDYAAEKAGLDFFSFVPGLPYQTSTYYVSTIETVFHGRYFNLVEFFNHIERLPRSVKPVVLEIVPSGDDGLPYLEMTIAFRVFFTTPKNVEKMLPQATPAATGSTVAPSGE